MAALAGVLFCPILVPPSQGKGRVKPLYGVALGLYVGERHGSAVHVSDQELRRMLATLAPYVRAVRLFGCSDDQLRAGHLAHQMGFQVVQGAWIEADDNVNERELAGLIRASRAGDVDLAVVGGEVLIRKELPPEQLVTYLKRFKRAVPGIPVSYNDAHTNLIRNPQIVAACDYILVNYYPYWEGIDEARAIDYLGRWNRQMQLAACGKPVIIGETGWPTAGDTIGRAVPSVENATRYLREFVQWAHAREVRYFYFEAFDEAWKAQTEGPQGAHWGLWDSSLRLKDCFREVLDGGFDSGAPPDSPKRRSGR